MRRRDPLDTARVSAEVPGPMRARAVRGLRDRNAFGTGGRHRVEAMGGLLPGVEVLIYTNSLLLKVNRSSGGPNSGKGNKG